MSDKIYFQTFAWWTRFPRPVRSFVKWVCGMITGHEISKTEGGYGGGDFVDRWCRWCNKLIQIPKCEMPSDSSVALWEKLHDLG